MKRGAVFQLRLSTAEAERLDREARERGMTKADLIRTSLGWPRAETTPRAARPKGLPVEQATESERNPGRAAMQRLVERLQKGT